jgi:hypothetical protein
VPKDGPLLSSNGGEVWPRRVESIAIRRILAPPADAPFGYGEATTSSESASTSVVVRGVPRDLRGNTAGEVVRQV